MAEEQTVTVVDLDSGREIVYAGLLPGQAVIAAYAQRHGDYNTWDYANRYTAKRSASGRTIRCGNFTAITREVG